MKSNLTREAAYELLHKYNKESFHIQHALTVEGVMRWYAKELPAFLPSQNSLDCCLSQEADSHHFHSLLHSFCIQSKIQTALDILL